MTVKVEVLKGIKTGTAPSLPLHLKVKLTASIHKDKSTTWYFLKLLLCLVLEIAVLIPD